MQADLRKGRWEDVLTDVEHVNCLLVDAPYSARTHSGHNTASASANRVSSADEKRLRVDRKLLTYVSWGPEDVAAFVASWAPRTSGWFVTLTDTDLAPVWASALEKAGRYVFSPLACMDPGSRVRISGDGPAQWSVWAVVARPKTREAQSWGALPGGYVVPPGVERHSGVIGGKPLSLMRALVRDYTRPGDLVCDPCCGGGTTLLAALTEGRRAVGAEMDPAHYEIARKRLARGYTSPLFVEGPARVPEQLDLTTED